ncbi:MAG: hypothetical protein HN742_23800 [Lentisphaerae bacterium]|jgi:hypothetical protein|nr:hypothetical protein [Lentisphaerota bacterium]MBT4822493.1 hypothetical protein [Lentisphaerota bacterium]MBT5612806.1 hypothetical protein [Lentisphaerota bacterium]MBT7057632.1 hypothetical protein [Lentisphaerota bacterium]MBT7844921.1 hypothetical protein [Lentisphaerota bacterium]
MTQPNWYRDTTCKIHFDMHTPEHIHDVGRDFDPQAFARAVKATGAEAVCFFARCAYGWAYYPTAVGLPHPRLTRDLFGEGVHAMKAEGLRVIAYCAIDNAPSDLAAEHPEWPKRTPEGEPVPGHGTATSACAFGPFPHELLIPQFQEIAERYPVDGFFLDGVYQYFYRICHCENCRRGFGRDIPQANDDPNWRAYRHWQVQNVWETMDTAARAVEETRPGCLMGVNWLASVRWSVPPPPAIGYVTGDPPMQNCTFETALNLAAWAWRDVPADIMTQRMLHSWQDFTCRTPETIQTEFATGLASGAKLFVGDLLQPLTVQPDPDVMALMQVCFEFAQERVDVAAVGRRCADIAILSSPETTRGQGATWTVDDTPLRGAYHSIVTAGLTVDILFDDDLAEHLSRYRTLIVPEQRFISRTAGNAIAQFVRSGGGLVVIGALPKCVDPNEPDGAADSVAFETLTGLRRADRLSHELGYLQLRGTPAKHLWRDCDRFRPAIPVLGTPAAVEPDGATVLVNLTAPGETYQIGAKPPGEILEAPAITTFPCGDGTVMYCALPLASDVWKRGNPGARYVLEGMVREVTPDTTVERIGPSAVQVYAAANDDETVIQLVTYQPDGRTNMPHVIESPCEMTGVQIRVRDARAPRSVVVEPATTAETWTRQGDLTTIVVPPFTIHTAVRIRWC